MTQAEEKWLHEAIGAARTIQTFLWGKANGAWGIEEWLRMLRKRVAKLEEVKRDNPHAIVELKKRLLQTAAVAVALLGILEERGEVPWDNTENVPSNLPEYAEPVMREITASEAREALRSLRHAMACDVRDWAQNRQDAWLYGIVVGWGRKALVAVGARHNWSPVATIRLHQLHEALSRAHGMEAKT